MAANWQQYAQYGACMQVALAILYFWTSSFILGFVSIAFAVMGVCGVLTGNQRMMLFYLSFVVIVLLYETANCVPHFVTVRFAPALANIICLHADTLFI